MSKIPPSLLYLTIYNPTIKPVLLNPEDEDAEELGHILFHTAREHAVSRDRILRQVGLAKALVNFSELFHAGLPCENVHSQARRMIMLSPEPDFWMHACYEVGKTPRPPPPASKGKEAKSKAKGKEKEQPARPTVLYDYHDSSVHDIALRTHFQRGYEEFKLLHGSFRSIMSNLGQQALELQLERFFTVWAWKWDVDDDDFGAHLGIPLHPSHGKLTPLLDQFASGLPDELMAFALMPPYLIPSRTRRYSPALVRYVLARIPPPATPISRNQPSTTVVHPGSIPPSTKQAVKANHAIEGKQAVQPEGGFTMPLAMPSMPALPPMPNMTFGLDMKNVKWNWPGYFTFGKGGVGAAKSTSPSPPPPSSMPASLAALVDAPRDLLTPDSEGVSRPGAVRKDIPDVDTASLLEAISTESIGSYTRSASPAPSALSKSSHLGEEVQSGPDASGTLTSISPVEDASASISTAECSPPQLPSSEIEPRVSRTFLASNIHIAGTQDPLSTQKKRVLHLTQGDLTVAIVVDMDHTLDLAQLAADVVVLIDGMQSIVTEESKNGEQQIPSAAKILQPKDRYVVSMDEYTLSSPGFTSRCEHLYNGQELLRSGLDITEVFSRGQNPQHWHIGKRGLGTAADGRQVEGEVFMEVARKETTLTDVDNELASVVRRHVEQL